MTHLLLVFVALSSFLATVFSESNDRIIGGGPVNIESAPFTAQLFYGPNESNARCGASIIGPKHLLTAAHCFEALPDPDNAIKVRVGSNLWNEGGREFRIKKHTIHPKRNADPRALNYDFAVIELDKEIEFDNSTQPIELATLDMKLKDGAMMDTYGWGLLTDNESLHPKELQKVSVPLYSHQKCKQDLAKHRGAPKITKDMICAGYEEGGKDACGNDSGGPLVHKNILVGVVSWGNGCAQSRSPGIYARVAIAEDWIRETMKL